jgi:hypothetical protein
VEEGIKLVVLGHRCSQCYTGPHVCRCSDLGAAMMSGIIETSYSPNRVSAGKRLEEGASADTGLGHRCAPVLHAGSCTCAGAGGAELANRDTDL